MGGERIRVFVSYAHSDRPYLDVFLQHIADLRRDRITVFHDNGIRPGQTWESVIQAELDLADIVVVLVSSAFVDSVFCMKEFDHALKRRDSRRCKIVPVNLRPVDLNPENPLSTLHRIPRGESVSDFSSPDHAWKQVASELRVCVEEIENGESPAAPETGSERPPANVISLARRRNARERQRGPQHVNTSSPRHTRPISNPVDARASEAGMEPLVRALQLTRFDGTDRRSFTLSTGRLREALVDTQLPSARAEELVQALQQALSSGMSPSATVSSIRKACTISERLRTWLLDILTGSGV